MADEMPAQLAGAQRNFRLRLLHLIFAEQHQAEFAGGADDFRRLRFGDGQQRDGIRLAVAAVARGANPLLN